MQAIADEPLEIEIELQILGRLRSQVDGTCLAGLVLPPLIEAVQARIRAVKRKLLLVDDGPLGAEDLGEPGGQLLLDRLERRISLLFSLLFLLLLGRRGKAGALRDVARRPRRTRGRRRPPRRLGRGGRHGPRSPWGRFPRSRGPALPVQLWFPVL